MGADTPIRLEAAPAEAAAWVATVGDHGLTVDVPPGPAYLLDGLQDRSTLVAREADRTVLFDGMLRNRAELGATLEYRARPEAGDAEFVLQAYRHWGEDLLAHLRGVFALVLWDRARALWLGARDQAGVYPLFYAEAGKEMLFSTSVEALVRHPGVSTAINRAAVADYVCHRPHDLEETYFSRVRRVPPAHVLRQCRGQRSLRRYWHPGASGTRVSGAEEVAERFSALLTRVVDNSISPGFTGILLSGGLDSGALAALASDASRGEDKSGPLAVSLVFPHPECNEEPTQKAVAAALGLGQLLVPFDDAVGPRGLVQAALDVSANWPTPPVSAWLPAYRTLTRQARGRGCRVVLSGTGGDEWLSVGMDRGTDLLRAGDLVGLLGFMALVRRAWPVSPIRIAWTVLWRFGARALMRRAGARALRRTAPALLRRYRLSICARPAWLAPDPDLRREIDRRLEARVEADLLHQYPQSFEEESLEETLTGVLFPRVLEELFEAGRRSGVRILMPYWDADVVDLLYHTPSALLASGGRTKGLLRAMLAQRLPGLGFERQRKVKADSFFNSCLFAEAPAAWTTMGGMRTLATLGIVDASLDGVIEAAIEHGDVEQAYLIWDGLTAEGWLRGCLGIAAAGWRNGHER
jgi:asparagine synthase (glutamine-hydrolysing)